jgi:mono/diheme cytochrome c family protein
MKQLCIGTAVLGAALVVAPMLAYAQMPVDIGKREYFLTCTVCHGDSGKGDGPLVEFLKKPPTDLTKIQKNNKGVFPFARVYGVIDGRVPVGAHGPREMPVWGIEYREDAAELTHGFGISPKDAESYVRGRIISLIGYIYSLQAK